MFKDISNLALVAILFGCAILVVGIVRNISVNQWFGICR